MTSLLIICSNRLVLDLVAKEELAKYNATSILIDQASTLVLPPIIGAIAWWSMNVAVFLAGVIACVGSLALAILSPSDRSGADTPILPWILHLKKGFKALAENRFQLDLSLIVMFINAIEAIPITFVFVYAHDALSMNAAEIGMLSTMAGIGGMVGAMLARRIKGDRTTLLGMLVGSIFLHAVVNGSVYYFDQKYVLFLCVALRTFAFVFTAVSYRSLRQESIDKAHFGVISSALGFIVKLGIPVGIFLGGWLMLRFGVLETYLFSFIAEVVLGIVVLTWVKRQLQTKSASILT